MCHGSLPAVALLLLVACRSPSTALPSPAPSASSLVDVPVAVAGSSPEAGPPSSAAERCTGPSDTERPSSGGGERLGLDDLVARRPRAGRFVAEGWVQIAHHCPPCPPGANCKPCEEVVWLSSVRAAYKDPLARDQHLVVTVPDARPFVMMGHYRVAVVACDVSSAADAPLTTELRGFEALP